MSATEWKFVPVEPTREMLVAALKTNGACPIYAAMLDAAPVPPSVESLLENWTPSDQQAFAKFRDEHFPGEMSSYAIQSLGSAWKDGQAHASTEVPQYTGTGSDSLDCILGVGGFASFGPLDAQPAAHLTIPGALEWDGDNGTHGVVGTHSADGESRAHGESCVRSSGPEGKRERFQKWVMATKHPTFGFLDGRALARGDDREGYADEYVQGLWVSFKEFDAQLANTEQSRRSFFDLSQDLEKRLAALKTFAGELISASFEGGSFDGGDIQDIAVKHGLLRIEQRTEECGEVCACSEYGFPAECYRKTDLVLGGEQAAKGGDDE
jgi:hypothetical protein